MTLTEASEIRTLFLSKAPKEYYLTVPNITLHGMIHGGERLFDGVSDKSMMIASIGIKAIDGDRTSVTLYIGFNSYEFIDSPELCKELIERFVPNITLSLPKSLDRIS